MTSVLGQTRPGTPAPQTPAIVAGKRPQALLARDAGSRTGENPSAAVRRSNSPELGELSAILFPRCWIGSKHCFTSAADPESWPATPRAATPALSPAGTPSPARGKQAAVSLAGGQENADPRVSLGWYDDDDAGPSELAAGQCLRSRPHVDYSCTSSCGPIVKACAAEGQSRSSICPEPRCSWALARGRRERRSVGSARGRARTRVRTLIHMLDRPMLIGSSHQSLSPPRLAACPRILGTSPKRTTHPNPPQGRRAQPRRCAEPRRCATRRCRQQHPAPKLAHST